jgi:hypothetical protein
LLNKVGTSIYLCLPILSLVVALSFKEDFRTKLIKTVEGKVNILAEIALLKAEIK